MDDAVSGDRLVSEYLSRLHAAAWVLPADRRTALVDGARHRLYAEIGDDADPARTRAAIAALGPPEDAVRREAATLGPSAPVPPRPLSVWGSREVAAVTERQCTVERMLAHASTARVRTERYAEDATVPVERSAR